mgnify:CR=1 FL=1
MSAFLDSVINNKPHSAGIHLACSTHRSGPGILRVILIHADKAINSAFTQPRSFANVLNISETAKEIHDKNMVFSPAALRELEIMESALREILTISIAAFVANDIQQAARVEPLEEIIDGLCDEMKSHHVDRLQSGTCTLDQGFVFNDLLTNYERVADHCSNIAVAIIELESDSFDTHEYLSSVRAMKSHSFARYYEEYQQKYHL